MSVPVVVEVPVGENRDVFAELKAKAETLRFGANVAWLSSDWKFTPSYAEYGNTWSVFRNPFTYNWKKFDETDRYHRLYLSVVLSRFREDNPFKEAHMVGMPASVKFLEFESHLEMLWNYCYVKYMT